MPEPQTIPDRPWIFALLIAPAAVVSNGVVQGGVLSFLLTQQGMRIELAAHWISILSLPTMLYFLYGPITDFLLRRRTWLLLSSFAAALLMLAAFNYGTLNAAAPLRLILLSGVLTQLVVASCGGIMGELHSERAKHRASSFYQAGSMGIGALATWLLIRQSAHTSMPTLGWIAAAMIALPGLFAFLAPAQKDVRTSGFVAGMRVVAAECRATFLRRDAIPYLLLMVAPFGSGAAIGLLPGIASDYHVGGAQVAWINGLLGALLIAAGSMTISLLPMRRGAVRPLILAGILNALTLLVLATLPLTPAVYLIGTLLYLFTVGCSYPLSTAVVLEFMGASGKSGSGRYSVLNGLNNLPVLAVIWADGWGAAHWGTRGLPATESILALLAAIPLLIYVSLRPLHRTVNASPDVAL